MRSTLSVRCGYAGLVMVAALIGGGCNVIGWVGQSLGSDEAPPVLVTAEYRGLDHQSVAVLVDADHATLFSYPTAQLEVCSALSNRIAEAVPGTTVVDPRTVIGFQQRNIYWNTATYRQLAEKLGVSRLVLVDLTEYRLTEPGNAYIYRGLITASVGVAETDGPAPNDMAYQTMVTASYPPTEQNSVGVPEADPATIRKGVLDLFTLAAAGKFYDHEERRR